MNTLIVILLLVIVLLAGVSVFIAYQEGVRDGYQNTFLPRVQAQIKKEKLAQGEAVNEN